MHMHSFSAAFVEPIHSRAQTHMRTPTLSSYASSQHFTLSTSNVSAPFLEMFAFGPVVADGYGIGYMVRLCPGCRFQRSRCGVHA